MAKDPVCGMDVDPKQAAGKSEYQGRRTTSVRLAARRRSTKSRPSMSASRRSQRQQALERQVR